MRWGGRREAAEHRAGRRRGVESHADADAWRVAAAGLAEESRGTGGTGKRRWSAVTTRVRRQVPPGRETHTHRWSGGG